jgi:hypothetical protein
VLKQAANSQILVSSDQHNGLVQGVLQHVPPAAQPGVLHTFTQLFDGLKQSLALAGVQGFVVVLVLCVLMILGTLLLKDISLKATQDEAEASTAESDAGQAEEAALQSQKLDKMVLRGWGSDFPATQNASDQRRSEHAATGINPSTRGHQRRAQPLRAGPAYV